MSEENSIIDFSQIPYSWQESPWQDLLQRFGDNKLPHSLLISGSSGLGKMDFLKAFSRLLVCKSPVQDKDCGSCASCNQGGNDFHPDILLIAVEEGSKEIKVDQIRAVSDFANKSSHSGSCKVVVIADAHKLNTNAANALLKTLEEPNSDTYIFLGTDLPGRLLPTIRSRCQNIKFPLPDDQQAEAWLAGRLADKHKGEIKGLLEAAGNRPLYALELFEEGELDSLRDFLDSLMKLKAGSANLQSVISLGTKIGEGKTLRYLSLSSTALIKRLVKEDRHDGHNDSTDNSAINDFCSTVSCSGSSLKPALQELMIFDQELNRARKQLVASTNPNAQLLLESIIWQWNKLPLTVS